MILAQELKVPNLTIGLMIGKAVKLAEGNLDTHSHRITLNRDFLSRIAKEAGCSPEGVSVIENMNMARELWSGLSEQDDDRFFPAILKLCHNHCSAIYRGDLEAVLIDDNGNIRYRI